MDFKCNKCPLKKCIVLKTGLDSPVRSVQLGIESQFGPVKPSKTGQQSVKTEKLVKNRAKIGVELEIKKKQFDDRFGF